MLSFNRFLALILWLTVCTTPLLEVEGKSHNESRNERTEEAEGTAEHSQAIALVKSKKLPLRFAGKKFSGTFSITKYLPFPTAGKQLITHQHLYLRHRTFII
jgi:hypothetical protein